MCDGVTVFLSVITSTQMNCFMKNSAIREIPFSYSIALHMHRWNYLGIAPLWGITRYVAVCGRTTVI